MVARVVLLLMLARAMRLFALDICEYYIFYSIVNMAITLILGQDREQGINTTLSDGDVGDYKLIKQ